MSYNETTKKLVYDELYKLCDGEETKQIVGEYPIISTWKIADIFRPIIEACMEHTSIKDICLSTDNPSSDTIYKRINELGWEQAEQLVNKWINGLTKWISLPKRAFITISIDFHQMPYYGNSSPEWVTGMKRKKGTNYAVTFMTVAITTRNIRCPLSVLLMTEERMKNKAALISDLLSQLSLNFPIRRVLLDRGFCQDDIIQLLEDRGLEWIIAATRKSGVKIAYQTIKKTVEGFAEEAGVDIKDKLALGRWARKQHLDEFKVESIFIRKKGMRVPLVAIYVRHRTQNKDPAKRLIYNLFLYLTNIDCTSRYIVNLYSKRWIIETDYRCIDDFLAVTNSTSPSLRIILYGLAVFFDVLWILFSVCENILSRYNYFSIDSTTRFLYKFSYYLICTARRFFRWLRNEILPLLVFR